MDDANVLMWLNQNEKSSTRMSAGSGKRKL